MLTVQSHRGIVCSLMQILDYCTFLINDVGLKWVCCRKRHQILFPHIKGLNVKYSFLSTWDFNYIISFSLWVLIYCQNDISNKQKRGFISTGKKPLNKTIPISIQKWDKRTKTMEGRQKNADSSLLSCLICKSPWLIEMYNNCSED